MNFVYEASLSFLITFVLIWYFIKWQGSKKIGQHVRKEGPDLHTNKEGTPTMAGLVFVSVFLIVSIAFDHGNKNSFLVLSTFLFFVIGYVDSVMKILKKSSEGLKTHQKLLLQIGASVIIYFFSQRIFPHDYTVIPFFGNWKMGWIYPAFAILFLTGMSNASNITDGLDGLAGGIYFTGTVGVTIFSIYNGLPLTTTLTSMGAVLAFLFFNFKPAKIFMGDVGSLALGGYIATLGILYGYEFWMILFFPIFVIELVCDTIQIVSIRSFHRKVFRMAPIHHHYEMKGKSEIKITLSFLALNVMIMGGSVGMLCVFH
ncbi:phospho-N-acetylmuramoyl-pentapeptide-transferase [Mesoaciditoga sp.]